MVIGLNAQIGYQVSLLYTATGEPRANESLEVTIEITDSEGISICKETKNATTNDFGVLSLQVGNATTFENADWSKLPFYVSATVDDILVGKSQILNVPVAEAAKTLVGSISKNDIIGEWNCALSADGDYFSRGKMYIKDNNTYYFEDHYEGDSGTASYINQGYYRIMGDFICFISTNGCGVSFAGYDNAKLKFGYFTCCFTYNGKSIFSNLNVSDETFVIFSK